VESVLRQVDLPLGPEMVPDMRVSGAAGEVRRVLHLLHTQCTPNARRRR